MRILFLTHDFNSLSQRLFVELTQRGHEVSVEFDISDAITEEAVDLYRPDVVVAPFLKRAIPESVWRRVLCLIVHPGPPGDRGPAALDWAILEGAETWGVTVIEAERKMDAGPVWASARFPMRAARKSSLYRNEVTEAAVRAMVDALARVESGTFTPAPLVRGSRGELGRWRGPARQSDRVIDWTRDDTATVLTKVRSADGQPGIEDELLGRRVRLFDAHAEGRLRGVPGELIARRGEAVCRATRDGAVWIGQLQPVVDGERTFKLPAARVLGEAFDSLPESELTFDAVPDYPTRQEIRYVEDGAVGYLHFDFYNGALGTEHCERLIEAYRHARSRPTKVIVLMGSRDFWSNGLHLNCIEAAESPADESWRNINAMDDLTREIITTDTHLTIAAMHGNAGAGGVFMALAADEVHARDGVILNPHYRNMGNLYGSEYWTYLLPRRVGHDACDAIMTHRLPMGVSEAHQLGLIDAHAGPAIDDFRAAVEVRACQLADPETFASRIETKRARDEAEKPLESYRQEELERMRLNFYGFDPSYHVARYRFVYREPHAWTPLHLALHRRLGWQVPGDGRATG